MTREEHYKKAEELQQQNPNQRDYESDQAFYLRQLLLKIDALTHATLANCRVKEVDHD